MNTEVTIIIPTFNRGELLNETLSSVIAQEFMGWECLVVDDGSTDATEETVAAFAKADSRIKYYKRPIDRPKGANACRNFGIEKSRGTYLMFLDSDDMLSQECIENRLLNIRGFNESMFVFRTGAFKKTPDDIIKEVTHFQLEKDENYLQKFLSYNIPWHTSSMFIERASLNVRFNEQLQRFQDVAFNIEYLLDQTCTVRVFKDAKLDSFYRQDDEMETRFKSSNFMNTINKSTFVYLSIILPKLLSSEWADEGIRLKSFYKRIFKNYILPHIKELDKDYIYSRNLLTKKGVISSDLNSKMKILEILFKSPLSKIKGIGIHRLKDSWLKN